MDIRELNEAKDAAKDAYRALERAEDKYSSARNWGIWDIFGGETFSSLIKHGKINDAEREMQDVVRKLNILQRELKDIYIDFRGYSKMTNFDRIFDIAFDNIFSDWNTQSKINNNLHEIKMLKKMVSNIIDDLNNME